MQNYELKEIIKIEGGKEILPIAISQPIICGTPTLMFSRTIFDSLGGTWISGIGNDMSDWALVCKALNQGWKVAALKDSFLKIYINHDAMKTVTSREKVASFRRVIHYFFPSIYYNEDDELKEEDEEGIIKRSS